MTSLDAGDLLFLPCKEGGDGSDDICGLDAAPSSASIFFA